MPGGRWGAAGRDVSAGGVESLRISAELIQFMQRTIVLIAGIDYAGLSRRCSTTPPTSAGVAACRADRRSPSRSRNICCATAVQRRAQGARSDPRLPARGHAEQAADPRALSQFDLPRPQRLWRAGRRARLFRQGRQRADLAGGRLSRGPAQGAVQLRSRARDPQGARPPQLRAPGMYKNGYITEDQGKPRRRRRSARSATAATRNSASRAAISWRKSAAS